MPRAPARLEGVSNDDFRNAALGDLVGTSTARPETAKRLSGSLAGGAVSVGAGGEAVGRNALTPEERRLLERYFK